MLRSCRWLSEANSALLTCSRRNARTGRMPFIVSANFTMTPAMAVERSAYTAPARRW